MIKTAIIKVKSLENEEIIINDNHKITITMVIMKIIIIVRMNMRIKIGNCIKI